MSGSVRFMDEARCVFPCARYNDANSRYYSLHPSFDGALTRGPMTLRREVLVWTYGSRRV
jgi:hypothetical protein